jgi:DNA-binding CsgD family transcriptional regulator
LLDRATESVALHGVLGAVRDGLSGVLVLHGDAGIGKTTLLEWAAGQAADMQLARVAGIQAEMGMGFAGLHQLLMPFLGGLDGLPGPQRQALGSAFGLVAGPPPDRFLVGLAALTLLTDAAAAMPVLCVVDDAQWLDQASVEVLGFVARRLYADRVGMLFTVREEALPPTLARLPELKVDGLPPEAAGELLAASAEAVVDGLVSARIVAGVAGNPLALVELARELTTAELAGTVPLSWPLRFGGQLEELYQSRVQALPADTRTLLLVAAADPTGDAALVYRAAKALGTGPEAGEAAGARRMVSWQPNVRFRHPLIRSAAYYAAPAQARRRAHAALAAATDPDADPDRRAWHLADAATVPDERVAAALERSAGRAQARGGLAATATFLERSVTLTADPARHAQRALSAAQASLQAGAYGRALELVATAEEGPLDELASARCELLRGHVARASTLTGAPALFKAARRLEPLDLDLARETYLTAWSAASRTAYLENDGGLLEISRAVRALPPLADPPRPVDLVLDGLAQWVTDGPAATATALRHTVSVFRAGHVSREEGLRWGSVAARMLWDSDADHAILMRQVELARAEGALAQLVPDLIALAATHAHRGDYASAASLLEESDTLAEVTGVRMSWDVRMFIAALRGSEAERDALMATAADSLGLALGNGQLHAAIMYNGLGRYDEAFAAARHVWQHGSVDTWMWVLPELIEAAVRTGHADLTAGVLARLAEVTQAGASDCGLGIEARSRALVSEGAAAEGCYQEAIDRLARTGLRPETARAHLLYGEWLRRQRRRRDARAQLGTAFDMFDSMGMAAYAARARGELRATGESAPARGYGGQKLLTPQEEQIARLVAEHLSNREIAARLFISASTVEYHLSKVFRKLAVSSRTEVARLRIGKAPSPD